MMCTSSFACYALGLTGRLHARCQSFLSTFRLFSPHSIPIARDAKPIARSHVELSQSLSSLVCWNGLRKHDLRRPSFRLVEVLVPLCIMCTVFDHTVCYLGLCKCFTWPGNTLCYMERGDRQKPDVGPSETTNSIIGGRACSPQPHRVPLGSFSENAEIVCYEPNLVSQQE